MSDENNAHDELEETTSVETQEADTDIEENDDNEADEAKESDKDREITELKEKNAKLYARVQGKKDKPKSKSTNSQDVDDLDKIEFFAQGGSKKEYINILSVMKGKDISFEEAKEDPMILAVKEQKERKAKEEKAHLGAAKGGGKASEKSGFAKPGLTPEEHKALWKKAQGR